MRLIKVSKKQMLAIKAVVHGCNTNKRLAGASYMANIRSESPEMISYYEAIKTVDEMLSQPTIEAEPVRHGEWISEKCNHKPCRIKNPEKWVTYKCSVCGYSNGRKQSNYCPNGGVKMGGDSHAE